MKPPSGGSPAMFQIIPSRLAEADSLCLKIRALLQSNTRRQARFVVELLARECLCNAVLHGNQQDDRKSVCLRLWIGRDWIRLQVSDEGHGFAWRRKRCKPSDPARPFGRGLQLCALYARRVRFNRRGNQITLWVTKH